jgi:uncharacterized protein (DUF2062 family)
MSRNELRNRTPFHGHQAHFSQGYRPVVKPATFGSVMVGICMYGVIMLAFVGTALPIVKWFFA